MVGREAPFHRHQGTARRQGAGLPVLAAGDAAAFARLYERHRGKLYRFLARQLHGNGALADELFQDVWQRVIAARKGWKPDAAFSTWLYRIAHNRLADVQADRQLRLQDLGLLLDEPRLERVAALSASARLPAEQQPDWTAHAVQAPVDVLGRRPDVQRARLQVDAALAHLKVAQAYKKSVLGVQTGQIFRVNG